MQASILKTICVYMCMCTAQVTTAIAYPTKITGENSGTSVYRRYKQGSSGIMGMMVKTWICLNLILLASDDFLT